MARTATELRKGTVFQLDSQPYKVLDYTHKMLGRGSSTVVVKIKNLVNGSIIEKTFRGGDNIDTADVTNRSVQYLYSDTQSHFMDAETYEQFAVASNVMEDKAKYIKEGDNVTAQLFNGQIINIELPKNVSLKVTYAEGAVRGDTSSAITKDATLETGLKIKVPAFIKTGDLISVNTETGAYRERLK